MDERIKELILEAGFPCFGRMYVVTDGAELEAFAQLIARECIDWCYAHATVDGTAQKIEESIRNAFNLRKVAAIAKAKGDE